MGKSRTHSIKDLADPVRQLFDSNKNGLNNFVFPENWTTRFLAVGIDYLVLLFVTGLVKDLVFAKLSISAIDYFLMMGAIALLYFVVAESVFGYTLGKRLFELKVVTVDGDKPDFRSAIIRNVSKIFFVLLIVDVVGSYFTTTNVHQRYADKIAQTTVEKL